MKKRLLSLALCLVLVVGLFSGLTVNASAGIFEDIEAKKKEIIEKLITEKISSSRRSLRSPIWTWMRSSAALAPRPPRATSV